MTDDNLLKLQQGANDSKDNIPDCMRGMYQTLLNKINSASTLEEVVKESNGRSLCSDFESCIRLVNSIKLRFTVGGIAQLNVDQLLLFAMEMLCEGGSRCGDINVIQLLLTYSKANINLQDKEGNTPLHIAIQNKDWDSVNILLQHKADVNIPNHKGFTTLDILIQEGPVYCNKLKPIAERASLETLKSALEKAQGEEFKKIIVDTARKNHSNKLNPTPLEAAKKVYNSYLLLHKLNELKIDGGKSLQALISEAANHNKTQIEFKVNGESYQVNITPEGKLEVLCQHTKPEVKDVLKYTDEDIIGLWANSEVSFEKDTNNNVAFAVGLRDESRLQDLKVGGLGKKVPFRLRFANFYKVIEILEDKKTSLKEKLRLANNIATGSGKTGDIALLKLWAYLADTPCITMVPDHLITQSNKFDEEFLPNEVAKIFGKSFSETNTRFATTTFTQALDKQWNVLNNKYGQDNGEQALILIDEAPKLKEKAVLLARAIAIARNNPVAFFSATPDAFLSEEFKIILQILLSPKERAALGVGKLPLIYYRYVPTPTVQEYHSGKASGYLPPEKTYVQKSKNTHKEFNKNKREDAVKKFKSEINKQGKNANNLSQSFLDFISQSLDSQSYKAGLIVTEERWAKDVREAITDNNQQRNAKRIDSFVQAIEGLDTGLGEANIRLLVEQNLNVEVGGQSLPYIKLHSIIDTFNEYKKSGKAVDKDQIRDFISEKYGIIDSDNLEFNSKLTDAILVLDKAQAEYQNSIKRNYPGDKKLYEYIFSTFPDIKNFCEQDVVVHYFNETVKCFDKNGQEKGYLNDGDAKNMLNIIKAGFVPNTLSKELAIGIDAPRLSRLAVIIKGKTDIINPMTELQAMGRVGRDVKVEGLCYFDVFTSDESYLEIDNINTLSGGELLKKLEESYKNYIQDEKCNIEGRSALLISDITQMITFYSNNPRFLEMKYYASIHDVIIDRVKDEFNFLNIQYCYDKETVIRVFTEVLQFSLKEGEATLSSDKPSLTEAKRHGTSEIRYGMREVNDSTVAELEKSINLLKGAIKDLQSNTKDPNSYWSCVAHAPIMTLEQIVNGDPNSDFPTFMEQKETSQQKNVSVHNASVKLSNTTGSSVPAKAPDAKASTGIQQNVGPSITAPSRTTPVPAQAQVSTGGQRLVSSNFAAQSQPIEQTSESSTTCTTVPLEDPSTKNESPQRTSTKKKVVYGFMATSPFLIVGIYTAIAFLGSTGLAFNPAVAAGIFVGVALAAIALFGIIKVCEKVSREKQENPGMGTWPALKEVLTPECLSSKAQGCPDAA